MFLKIFLFIFEIAGIASTTKLNLNSSLTKCSKSCACDETEIFTSCDSIEDDGIVFTVEKPPKTKEICKKCHETAKIIKQIEIATKDASIVVTKNEKEEMIEIFKVSENEYLGIVSNGKYYIISSEKDKGDIFYEKYKFNELPDIAQEKGFSTILKGTYELENRSVFNLVHFSLYNEEFILFKVIENQDNTLEKTMTFIEYSKYLYYVTIIFLIVWVVITIVKNKDVIRKYISIKKH